jgi:hypothetical protein
VEKFFEDEPTPRQDEKHTEGVVYCGDCANYKKITCNIYPDKTGMDEGTHSGRFGCASYTPKIKDCGFTLATCPYEREAGITRRKEDHK